MDIILKSVTFPEPESFVDYKINKRENDIFSYTKAPSDKLGSLEAFCQGFKEKEYDDYEDNEEGEEKKDKDKCHKVLSNITNVIVEIDYPVSKPAIFKFDCTSTEVTYGLVLYLYTYAYQLMYKLEDEDVGESTNNIPGMLNRERSEGRFGIWGHDIGDLVYNGISTLSFSGDTVICYFSCDS